MRRIFLPTYIWELLKEIFNVQNIVFFILALIIGLSSDVQELLNANVHLILASIFIIIIFTANYNLWKRLYKGTIKRPQVTVDLDLKGANMGYLLIRNIGNEDAVNVKIRSQPKIELRSEFDVKQITTIPIGGQLRYLWGFLNEKSSNILKEFKISLEYEGHESQERYKEKRILDPRQLIGASVEDHPDKALVDRLDKIGKSFKELVKTQQGYLESFKRGVIVRNPALEKLSLDDKVRLILRTIEEGNKEDTWLNPFVYDFIHLLNIARTDTLAKPTGNKKLIDSLNETILHFSNPYLGDAEAREKLLERLKKEIKGYLQT
ncbi:hypothetical protein F4X86_01455 [Candidatus Saccharibacteria bacterium]|nr:hypothetical protein [Candidatus Saccharibacteria bacterium]